jgi:FKBP-type peptidyl-prolyl cis-trans isomerase FkpA
MKPVYSAFVVLALVLASAPACAMQESDQPEAAETGETAEGPAADDPKTLYALGLAVAQGLTQFHLTEEELQAVQEGLADGVLGREPDVDLQAYMMQIQQLAQERAQAAMAAERQAGTAFLEQAADEQGAVKTDSGLIFQSLEEGTGESPEATDRVSVHYRGTLRDGTVFDSSHDRGQPAAFGLDQVIPCWTEGLQKMKEGGKAKLVCPPDIAYGDRTQGPIPGGATLVFEVELLDVVDETAAEPPAAQAAPAPAPEPEPEPEPPPPGR